VSPLVPGLGETPSPAIAGRPGSRAMRPSRGNRDQSFRGINGGYGTTDAIAGARSGRLPEGDDQGGGVTD
jgi:hypothetical protein